MKYFELDKNERKILGDLKAGKIKSIKGLKAEVLHYRQAARQTLAKTRNINIRLSNLALQKIRARALEKGLPYQTLISSLLHQYSICKIRETVK